MEGQMADIIWWGDLSMVMVKYGYIIWLIVL